MKKAKFTEVRLSDYVDKHGNKSANVTFDNGDSGLLTFKPEKQPNVGDEFEYEIEEKVSAKGNKWNKIKRYSPPFQKGGYKKPTLSFTDVKRMVRSNAVHAVVTVNSAYNTERLLGDSLKVIESFTLGDISGDIEKFSEEDSLLTSRLASVNNAANMSGYKTFNNAKDLIQEAEKLYKYIKG